MLQDVLVVVRNILLGFPSVYIRFCIACIDLTFHERYHFLLLSPSQALQWHRVVQAGTQKRSELLNALKRKKAREALTVETLKSDEVAVQKTEVLMRYWLRHEESTEATQRWRLLRERELRCISGNETFCDFFTGTFLAEDELYIPNAPFGYMAKTRNRKELSVDKGGAQIVGDFAHSETYASLSPLERVRTTLCTVDDLIPDENLRVHINVGDYLSFQNSPGGHAARKKTPAQQRAETLFVRFFEMDDKYGKHHGHMLLGELLSLTLLPATIPVYTLHWAYSSITNHLWQQVHNCANSTATGLLTKPFQAVCHQIVQGTVPGTVANEIVNAFDYTQYSALSSFLDFYVHPYRKTPRMIMKLLWYAPTIYWRYYVEGHGALLPPSRHSCLLREGIKSAKREIEFVRTRLLEEEELSKSLSAKERLLDAALAGSTRDLASDASGWVDYGEQGEFETLKRQCVESPTPLGSPAYRYKLCYFAEITQIPVSFVSDTEAAGGQGGESITLGRFAHWGPQPESEADTSTGDATVGVGEAAHRGDPSKQFQHKASDATAATRAEAADRSKSDGSSSQGSSLWSAWTNRASAALSALGAGQSLADRRAAALTALRSTPGYFTHQMYTHGDMCESSGGSRARVAQVSFVCAPSAAIEAVEEREQCVYHLRVASPMACTADVEAASLARLDELGVFGYTQKTSKVGVQKAEETLAEKRKKEERSKLQEKLAAHARADRKADEAMALADEANAKESRKILDQMERDKFFAGKGGKAAQGGALQSPGVARRKAGEAGALHMDVVEAVIDAAGKGAVEVPDTEFLSLLDPDKTKVKDQEAPPKLANNAIPKADFGLKEDEMLIGGIIRKKRKPE